MGAFGQSPCEWCRQMVDDQDLPEHACLPCHLKEHIARLSFRIQEMESPTTEPTP